MFQSRYNRWESLKNLIIMVDGRIRTHDPKNPMVLPTTPFVEELRGVLVRLTTRQRLPNNSLPKLKALKQQQQIDVCRCS